MKKLFLIGLLVAGGMAFAHYDLRKEARINVLQQTHISQGNMIIDAQNANRQLSDQLAIADLQIEQLQKDYAEAMTVLEELLTNGAMW
ncbi:MAG: hypothetical protein AMXMBFR16_10830 [Candidatus Uhrbacteria bacterium]